MGVVGEPGWIDEWPGEFLAPGTFAEYRQLHVPVRPNPHPPEDREERNTQSHHSRRYGHQFERELAERHRDRFNFSLPENDVDRGYDALMYILTENGLLEKQIQVKGCFHSKKSNPSLNPRISIPYSTHNGNGDDYLYHLGVYTFVDDIEDMEVLGETVLGYDAFDALMTMVEEEDPVGTNIQDKAERKNHALIEWDLAFRYAEDVHRMYQEGGIDSQSMDELYDAAKRAASEYEEREERQISIEGRADQPADSPFPA